MAPNRHKTNTYDRSLGLIFSAATRFFRTFQKKVDPAFDIGVAVLLEMQLGDVPEAQAAGQFVTQKMPGVFEGVERFFLLALVPADGDADMGMAAVHTDVNFADFDGQKPRVGGFKADDFGKLLADGFGDT